MSTKADWKHSFGLFLIALGSIGLLVAGIGVAVGLEQPNPDSGPAWPGCSAASGMIGGFLLCRGVVMRNRAVARGSTAHLDQARGGWTTRSGSPKPGFLRDRGEPDDPTRTDA